MKPGDEGTEIALRLSRVSVVRGGRLILDGIEWEVRNGERWIVLGPNGSGKTTLMRVASLYLHPSSGDVEVLGAVLGRVDIRRHRARIGIVSAGFADLLRPGITALEIVMSAKNAALETWWHDYDEADRARALGLLERFGCSALADHELSTLSSGERQRVQLARSMMSHPGLLLLDEPNAGLDLGGREDLIGRLTDLARNPDTPPVVLITHHVEEIPPGFTHVLLLRAGSVLAIGPLAATLDSEMLGACFGLPLQVETRDGRWSARRVQ